MYALGTGSKQFFFSKRLFSLHWILIFSFAVSHNFPFKGFKTPSSYYCNNSILLWRREKLFSCVLDWFSTACNRSRFHLDHCLWEQRLLMYTTYLWKSLCLETATKETRVILAHYRIEKEFSVQQRYREVQKGNVCIEKKYNWNIKITIVPELRGDSQEVINIYQHCKSKRWNCENVKSWRQFDVLLFDYRKKSFFIL